VTGYVSEALISLAAGAAASLSDLYLAAGPLAPSTDGCPCAQRTRRGLVRAVITGTVAAKVQGARDGRTA
jgi:hypothetical protein